MLALMCLVILLEVVILRKVVRNHYLLRKVKKAMDQEREAIDNLTVALTEHFVTVDSALAKIIELAGMMDVDNSEEIAAIATEVQASTVKINEILNPPPIEEPPVEEPIVE